MLSASVGNALRLVGAPMALMEQLQAIVLPENAHNTTTSGLLKKFKVSNTRALSLTPWCIKPTVVIFYLCLRHCKCSEKLISDYLDHYTSKRWTSWLSAMVSPSEGAGGHGGEADQAAD